MKGKVLLALVFGALTSWLKAGLLEANGGHLHIGDLSSGASIAITVAGVSGRDAVYRRIPTEVDTASPLIPYATPGR